MAAADFTWWCVVVPETSALSLVWSLDSSRAGFRRIGLGISEGKGAGQHPKPEDDEGGEERTEKFRHCDQGKHKGLQSGGGGRGKESDNPHEKGMPSVRVERRRQIGVPPIHWSELVDPHPIVYSSQVGLRGCDRGGRSICFVSMGAGFMCPGPKSFTGLAFSAEVKDSPADSFR